MRLAIVSTPRSGNTWLRFLLAGAYQLEQFSAHDPAALDWSRLPDRCIVQVHWPRTPTFLRVLADNRFRVVTISRHPLDVLLSILHFGCREPDTRHWLLGEAGDETSIHGKRPSDSAFTAYATGPRAQALLAVSVDWWTDTEVAKVRYEELVAQTAVTLERLGTELGPFVGDAPAVIAACSLSALRATSMNNHFWQGTPGLWKSLLTREQVETVAQANAAVFARLGYSVDQPNWPDAPQASNAWAQVSAAS